MANNWNQQWLAGGGTQSSGLINHGAGASAASNADYQMYAAANAPTGADGSQVYFFGLLSRINLCSVCLLNYGCEFLVILTHDKQENWQQWQQWQAQYAQWQAQYGEKVCWSICPLYMFDKSSCLTKSILIFVYFSCLSTKLLWPLGSLPPQHLIVQQLHMGL